MLNEFHLLPLRFSVSLPHPPEAFTPSDLALPVVFMRLITAPCHSKLHQEKKLHLYRKVSMQATLVPLALYARGPDLSSVLP